MNHFMSNITLKYGCKGNIKRPLSPKKTYLHLLFVKALWPLHIDIKKNVKKNCNFTLKTGGRNNSKKKSSDQDKRDVDQDKRDVDQDKCGVKTTVKYFPVPIIVLNDIFVQLGFQGAFSLYTL